MGQMLALWRHSGDWRARSGWRGLLIPLLGLWARRTLSPASPEEGRRSGPNPV